MKSLQPIDLNDLLRLGSYGDGGYILSKSQLEKTTVLLSFGINDDWTFERDFARKINELVLLGFDYSVNENMFSKKILIKKIFESLKLFFIKRKFLKSGQLMEWIRNKMRFPFSETFNNKNRVFYKKFLGKADDELLDNEQFVSARGIFSNFLRSTIPPLGVFIKIDIEGKEYEVLQDFEPYFEFINGFAIEFHDLDIESKVFEKIIKKLKENFYIAHVHGNNNAGIIRGTNLPQVLEITFINKNLVESPKISANVYPIKNLDVPCNLFAPDLPLCF